MSFFITIFQKIGNGLRAVIRTIRKALCCRRRQHDSEPLLPVTSVPRDSSQSEHPDFSNWDDWGENIHSSPKLNAVTVDIEQHQTEPEVPDSEGNSSDDYFKDMVPQFRRAKKIVLEKSDSDASTSSRLSMDPKAFFAQEAELGFLADKMPTTWEAGANLEEIIDPDGVIKEKRLEEKLKRIEEHQRKKRERVEEYQRRKQEKEARRPSLKAALSASVQSLNPLKDKTKNS